MSASVSEQLFGEGRLVKQTGSVCPVCLVPIQADVLERHDQVWMDKRCDQHGEFSSLLSSHTRHYYETIETPATGQPCCSGGGCGLPATDASQVEGPGPWVNHSCTVLIEIIERCNLSCPTCFAGSSPQHSGLMSLNEFERQVDQLANGGKRGSDMIQISGGEPTIHPELFKMVRGLFKRGFNHVCINSNGIKLAQTEFVESLAACRQDFPEGRIFIYLQFDGFDHKTHQELRGRSDLLEIKQKALANCRAAGIKVHPVMTLTRGINDHEVGDFIQLAVDQPWLKNVVIQPAMYSGRYENPRRIDRLTLADAVMAICEQFGAFSPEDFMPIPCSDPNCFGMAVALRTPKGLLPISRFFPAYETWSGEQQRQLMEKLTDTINGPAAISEAVRWLTTDHGAAEVLNSLDESEVDRLLDALGGLAGGETTGERREERLWESLLTISIKPFMDAYTYDQDRIDQCCVHILDKTGQPVSFCEFNAIHRPQQTVSSHEALGIRVLT